MPFKLNYKFVNKREGGGVGGREVGERDGVGQGEEKKRTDRPINSLGQAGRKRQTESS